MRRSLILITFLLSFASVWGELHIYHNVHYAKASPFDLPSLLPFDLSGDYSARGPVCYQYTDDDNRKWGALGHCERSLDCQVLSVYTPIGYGEAGDMLPVFVYIHGGSYCYGGSEQLSNDLSELAEREQLVCVSISYRLGAWGYLYDPERMPSDRGLQDQLCALRWVQKNISAFGGDPDRVTLSGQSAGAQSVVFLLSAMEEPLVSQAVIFSACFGAVLKEKKARKVASAFYRYLGHGDEAAGREALFTASPDTILRAAALTERDYRMSLPFMPSQLKQMPHDLRCASGLRRVVVCSQAEDGSMFGPKGLHGLATKVIFENGAKKYAAYLRRHGVDAQYHCFKWRPEGSAFGAAHCCELPLFEGKLEDWDETFYLGKTSQQTLAKMRDEFIPRLGLFVRTGIWSMPQDISTLITP